ncbi:RrF2 family transcriptional regulator [Catellatospora coxensis]|uniref:HTH-type transcriptional repressor NsrR n=1 Tax=Catellatospora coxensis TaxID=310354 RepID=A0A8J3KVZ9_9ACTN|nr:Rrf2 family transcriptional regulator [Catellatospora coxensis]GIG07198.1 HTH-type transcriptional repressor NsrR [Catellatospora coxensis]
MKLNRATDIALRVAMATAARDGLWTVDELADRLAVPRNHVAKVVQRLQHLGVLVTTRGRAGGVALAADARTAFTVGQIVRAFEGEDEVVSCDEPPCPLRSGCRLRSALRRAQQAFLASLDEVRLDDLLAAPTGPLLLSLGS